MADRTVLYQSVGAVLTHFDVDVQAATLTPRTSVTLPSNVQYAWPHPSRKFVYVSTSDAASGNTPIPGVMHRICALRVAADGSAAMHGDPQPLPSRPIHHSVNPAGTHVLSAFNNPSHVSVHPINADGTLGAQVAQKAKVDVGIYAHQVVVAPSNRIVIFPARGNDARDGKPEDPGAIKVFGFDDGQLTDAQNIVGGRNGFAYRPRHVDFHPTRPWMYANIESQNEIHMHRLNGAGDALEAAPAFTATTLAGPHDPRFHQTTSAIHHVRTFSIDPSGRLLVAGSIRAMWTHFGGDLRLAPAGLSVFRIGADGRLELIRKYDVELNGKLQWWTGMMGL